MALGIGWLAIGAAVYTSAPKKSAAPKLNYSRDILPILSDKCFKCHGPDSSSRMADMRLDTAQGAFKDRGGRWPIVPGKPQDSLVIKRITSKDSPMPPPYSGKSLTKDEIAKITTWISQGAEYDRLWSFNPLPASVPVPGVKGSWPRNPIDKFVLAGLQKAGLHPSRPASRERLLRRVTLDLTGLPPTEKEIEAFLADKRPDAYERVVDRLLASPHFGERAAVDWLDAARYSDSYGYQSDLLMPAWPYRDWVVKALNDNMPYDRFLTDQLAGDLLPNPTRDEILATAFNRLHRQSNEGGSIPADFKNEYVVDRVSTFGTAMLGLTLGCARCHDHKFDPISQKEFYQLYAYFNSIDEFGLLLSTEIVPTPSLLLPTPAQEAQLDALRKKSDEAFAAISKAVPWTNANLWAATRDFGLPPAHEIPDELAHLPLDRVADGKFANTAPRASDKVFGQPLADPKIVDDPQGPCLQFDGDNGLVVRGLPAKERWDAFSWSFRIKDPRETKGPVVLLHRTGGTDVGFCGFDLMLEDGYLTARVMRHWPGNAIGVRTKLPLRKNSWTYIGWTWDGSGRAAGLRLYVDGVRAETTVLNDRLWKTINAYGDLGPSGGDWSFAQRFRDLGFKGGRLADVVFADRAISQLEMSQLAGTGAMDRAFNHPQDHQRELTDYYLTAHDSRYRAAMKAVQDAQRQLALAENGVYEVEVMHDTTVPTPAYLLARGAYDAPKNASTLVWRDTPKSLPPLPKIGSNNRLTLARWITEPNFPLTARVAVNRFWQMIFGVGLVETSENFGVQGARPTKPLLLDYLARQFVNDGWNVKALVREMVLSSTYRQDSARTKKELRKDPENKLLSRGPSQRLSAEMIRDTALAAAGLLNDKIGGPPVNPYQPAGIWQEVNTMSPPFVQSKGADLYRRSLYSTWKRTTPVPSMMMFDATSREACTMRRAPTNTPLQALVLLNDVQFVEAARVLAQVVLERPGDDPDRLRLIFLRLAGRNPTARETSILLETLQDQRKLFEVDPKSASKLIAVGESKAPKDLNPVELAAMTVTVQTVLNSDATVWKR